MPKAAGPGRRPTRAIPYAEEAAELVRAAQQIGATAEKRLDWLIGFVKEDPAAWLPGEAESSGWRLQALALPMPSNFVGGIELHAAPPDEVRALHGALRAFLQRVVSAPAVEQIPVPTEGLVEVLVRATGPGVKPAIFGVSRGGPITTMIFQAVKALVLEAGDRLIACRECGGPCLALRKRLFCSDECAQRWHGREKAKRKKKGGQ